MGIDINERVVSLTDEHERLVGTSSALIPKTIAARSSRTHQNIVVTYLFPRNNNGNLNDGSPLALALKRYKGFSISRSDKLEICRRAIRIGRRTISPGDYDVIVPMPSSSDVAMRIARIVRAHLGESCIIKDVLRKSTVGETISNSLHPNNVPRRFQADYKHELGRLRGLNARSLIEVKNIGINVRKFFSSISIDPNAKLAHKQKVVIVDDIYSTGSSFSSAGDQIRQYFRPNVLDGFALIGPIAKS